VNVLMFSIYREDQYAIRALKAGASGYLNKQSSITDLIHAIRQLAATGGSTAASRGQLPPTHTGSN